MELSLVTVFYPAVPQLVFGMHIEWYRASSGSQGHQMNRCVEIVGIP